MRIKDHMKICLQKWEAIIYIKICTEKWEFKIYIKICIQVENPKSTLTSVLKIRIKNPRENLYQIWKPTLHIKICIKNENQKTGWKSVLKIQKQKSTLRSVLKMTIKSRH